MTWLKGILWFFPSLLIFKIIIAFISITYKPVGYYFYYLMRDHFLLALLATGGYFLFFRFEHPRAVQDTFLHILSFFCGFFIIAAVTDFFTFFDRFDCYTAFILPSLRLFTIICISLLINKFIDGLGLERIVIGILLVLVPAVAAFISFFYNINLGLLAFFLSIGLFGGACAAGYFLKDF